MSKKPCISKKCFCEALAAIKKQDEIYREVSESLEKIVDGVFVLGADNKYLEALLNVLKEAVGDKYDYIGWWLYEATDEHMVWNENTSQKWCLKEAEDLYDFIINECG